VPNEWDLPPADDAEEEIEDEEIGPDDPDYDLSTARGYSIDQERLRESPMPHWLLWVVSVLLVAALLVPGLLFLLQRG
jgi:hypothetical protein